MEVEFKAKHGLIVVGVATINSGTVVTSMPPLNITQTWNSGAVAFTGIKSDITNTASAVGSKLLDLQVGGVSKFSVDIEGTLTGAASALKSATTNVDVSAATAPTSGQVLTATSSTTATWQNAAGGGVSSISVASANGFAGTSSGGATPALTLSTSITGLLKGNGTAISAGVSNTDYLPAASPIMTGGIDLNGSQKGAITAMGALDIDCSTANYFTKTINGNSTFTVSNIPSSRSYSFTLELTHTSGSITWFSGVVWPGDLAPSLTAGKVHLFFFHTDDGGTKWRSSFLPNYAS